MLFMLYRLYYLLQLNKNSHIAFQWKNCTNYHKQMAQLSAKCLNLPGCIVQYSFVTKHLGDLNET